MLAMVTAGIAVPLMVMDWGEFAALSVIVRVVVRSPAASGEKIIDIVQEVLAAIVPLQLLEAMLKSARFEPLRTTLRICSGALPEFVTVTVCGSVEVPCAGVPGKFSADAGLRVTAGDAGAGWAAVPESAMHCGLPAALSVTKSVAWLVPTEVGA